MRDGITETIYGEMGNSKLEFNLVVNSENEEMGACSRVN